MNEIFISYASEDRPQAEKLASALRERGWDVERDGLSGAPRIRMFTGDHRHGSIERAVRLLGLGSASVTDLPTGDNGQLS